MPKPLQHKVLLGFDFGMRCIGVAVGQTLTGTASPLPILSAKDGVPDWALVKELIQTWQVDGCVVGLPDDPDYEQEALLQAARRFANKLFGRFHLPTYTISEELTTIAAKRENYQHDRQKIRHDSLAAKLILESWLNDYKRTHHD